VDDFSLLVEILTDILGNSKRQSYRGQLAFDCPVCSYEIKGLDEGDGKGNFEVNLEKGVYKCWSCYETHNTSGNLYMLVKKWGTKAQYKQLELLMPEEIQPEKKKYHKVRLPKEFIRFADVTESLKLTHYYKQAENYIKSRSITDEQLNKYSIGFCPDGEYGGRIIIPSFDRDKTLNYFVGRSYVGHKQKYKNPEAEKETIIFNEGLIDWTQDVYLVEGAFDSIFVPNSIALLGKFMSDYLWSRLYNEAQADIYILLDGDAWRNSELLYAKLNGGRLHRRIKAIKLPEDKDIADLKGIINQDWVLELEY
jgi:DNA primase